MLTGTCLVAYHMTRDRFFILEEQWVSNVRNFSSQAVSAKDPESIAWNAVQVMGPPDVYPKHEQNPLAWSVSPANVKSTEEFLEVRRWFIMFLFLTLLNTVYILYILFTH